MVDKRASLVTMREWLCRATWRGIVKFRTVHQGRLEG
jgi:hypothetical protein